MTTTQMPQMPQEIQANIHQDAITRVSGFFNATIEDILNELLQNARRAGATWVHITKEPGRISIQDNGRGIGEPQAILSFGQSEWDQVQALNEHPAGMGLYALARNENVTIRSRSQDTNTPWQVDLTPDHFVGKLTAPVNQLPERGIPTGTTITFNDETSVVYLDHAVKNAATFYPLPVFLNNEQVEKQDFLKDAVYTHNWEGVRIGIYNNRYNSRGINFHGIVVDRPTLPELGAVDTTWISLVDIIDCPHLELTLPARKEAVQTPFLDELRNECRKAIFTAISLHNQHVDLTWSQQQEAANMGIHIQDARPKLLPWSPINADYATDINITQKEQVKDETILMDIEPEASDQQTLARALDRAGITHRFAKSDSRLRGYPWYDRIPAAVDLTVTIVMEDEHIDLTQHRQSHRTIETTKRADSITFNLEIATDDEDHEDEETQMKIDGDLVFENEEIEYGDDQRPIITRDNELDVRELASLMYKSYFSPSCDGSSDSYETQKHNYLREFETTALMYLSSREDALKTILLNSLDHIRYQMPPDVVANIRMTYHKVLEITIEEQTDTD